MAKLDHGKHEKHESLLYQEEAFRIRGAIFEVSRELGVGFLEPVYQECLAIEFASRGIALAAATVLNIRYKGQGLKQTYVPDFVCFNCVLIELKAVREIAPGHLAQTINDL